MKGFAPWILLLILMIAPPLVDYNRTGKFGKLTYIAESIAAIAVVALVAKGAINQSKD